MAGAARQAGHAGWRILGWGGAAALVAMPLVAMQFTDEVVWTGSDFVFAAILVASLGLGVELAFRAARSTPYRLAAITALGTAFFLIWSNLAVGLIGSENNPANLLYAGVLAFLLVGGLLVRFRPAGMARVLAATAAAQVGVAAIALAGFAPSAEAVQPGDVAKVTAFFVAFWLLSAGLFLKAARVADGTGRP